MNGKRLGQLIRDRREDKHLEAAELERRVKMGKGDLGKYERGERKFPLEPRFTNAIAAELGNVSVLELVMAMGYQIRIAGLSDDELALVDEYRRLTPAHRAGLSRTAQALRESQSGEAAPTPALD